MIPPIFIQDLLSRVDIVEVVGSRVQLKKTGANFVGLCPFHSEKTPSFTVSPSRQSYHCFGCGHGGSAISFLMEFSGLNFVDAVEELARSAGMTVPQEKRKISGERKAEKEAKALALTEVMGFATDYYRQQLKYADNAIVYLKSRGLSGEIARRFAIGYAPDDWNALKNAMPDYNAGSLVEAGLVIEKEGSGNMPGGETRRYDRFRGRIMFPIRNVRGQVIAFGGRVLDKSEPKYLNSPETPIFRKGTELYGLFEARQAIRRAGYVLVVEGYMDVVALVQMGIENAVATLGTACTPVQIRKLMRQTDRIVFSFDGDKAGRTAARRAMETCLPFITDLKSIRFLFLPEEHDPDSYIRAFGAEEFEKRVDEAVSLPDFLVREAEAGNDLETMEGRARTQVAAKSWLLQMPPSALRKQIVREIARKTKVLEGEVVRASELKREDRVASPTRRADRPQVVSLARHVVRLLLRFPQFVQELEEEDKDGTAGTIIASSSGEGELLAEIAGISHSLGAKCSHAAVIECLLERNVRNSEQLVREIQEMELEEDIARKELRGAIRKLRLQAVSDRLNARMAAWESLSGEEKAECQELRKQQEALKIEIERERES